MRQVIAMGDGGIDVKNPLMDLYILAQSGKRNPKICFLGTASGDNSGYSSFFKDVFKRYPCEPSSLSLFNPHTADIEDFLMNQDIIYVGGGQSKSMLGVWKEWNLDKMLRKAYENGTILSGGSAGSVCWFNECVTDSIPGSLTVMKCLGIIPYSNCPHFASDSRRAAYSNLVRYGEISAGYAADDYAALHFVDEKLFRSVSNRPYAKTWKLGMEDGSLSRSRLKTKWLGAKEYQEEFIFNTPTFEYMSEEGPVNPEPEIESTSTEIIKVDESDSKSESEIIT